jgi:hypothetical protein
MKKVAILSTLFISALAIALVGSLASATVVEARTVDITIADQSGNVREDFVLGETVVISWTANGAFNMIITDANGNQVPGAEWSNLGTTGSVEFTPASPGDYYVEAANSRRTISIEYFFVMPESILGGISAIGACFAALGTVAVVKSKKKY